MTVDPHHLKFTHPIRLRRAPTKIQTVEEAIDFIDTPDTSFRVRESLQGVRANLYAALGKKSQKDADDARDQMVHVLDGMRMIHRA